MNRGMLVGAAAMAVLTVGIVLPLWSEDKSPVKATREKPEWMQKGPEHEKFEARVGTYDVLVHTLEAADEPASDSYGTAEITLIMDGRFLQQKFDGKWYGHIFTGLEICGYDRVAGKYTSFWCDSLGTACVSSSGDSKDGGTTIQFRGETLDPATRKLLHTRSVCTEKNADEFKIEMYCDRDGTEKMAMRMEYKRRRP